MSTPPPPPGYNPPPPGFNPPPPGFGGPQYGTPAPPPPYGSPPPPGYQPYPNAGYANQGYGTGPRQYASIGARFGALLLDGLISGLFTLPGIIALFAAPRHYTDCTVNGESGICHVPTGAGWAVIAALWALGTIAYIVIYCKKVGAGQSWGMKACGIRVADKNTDQPIGTGRAVGRYFARFLSSALCGLGFLWALWDKEKQTWHDKLVNTVVVKA